MNRCVPVAVLALALTVLTASLAAPSHKRGAVMRSSTPTPSTSS